MNHLLLAAGLLVLASCGSNHEPKFTNPVVVVANDTPIYVSTMLAGDKLVQGRVLVLADKGDTLQFDSVDGSDIVRVQPDAHLGRFPGGQKSGYLLKKYLTVPAEAVARYDSAHAIPASGPGHLNKR